MCSSAETFLSLADFARGLLAIIRYAAMADVMKTSGRKEFNLNNSLYGFNYARGPQPCQRVPSSERISAFPGSGFVSARWHVRAPSTRLPRCATTSLELSLLFQRFAAFFRPTFRYWNQTEVHVYAGERRAFVFLLPSPRRSDSILEL
jgi:hypothetical protein